MKARYAMGMMCALVAALWGAQALADNTGWRVIDRDRGITVSVRDEPGRQLPTFRGQGKIKGSVLHVLSLILDIKGATDWAKGADETELVRELNLRTHLIYTRTDTPWPVSDRDMVMKREVEVLKPGQEFRVHLVCEPKQRPEKSGVIRVKDCDSFFLLRKVDANTTYVDYMVSIDPGGNLPDWLIKWASKRVPFDTLVDMEKQVEKTPGKYDAAIALWADAS